MSNERKREVNVRKVSRKLIQIQKMGSGQLTIARPLERRLVSNCRDFTVMLCAMLRRQGVPSRARCGFATYFASGKFEDHWICEYWNAVEQRWVMVNSQLDAFQRKVLQIRFDPCDMPPNQFLPAGKAWQLCRAGQENPDLFGIFDMHGMWFIRGDLLRDLASLNKVELLPWDCWGLIEKKEQALSNADLVLLDKVAASTLADNGMFSKMRSTYENKAGLRVPSVIKSYSSAGTEVAQILEG